MGNRRSSGRFRTSCTCKGCVPVCNVSKAHDLCSRRQHCNVRTSRNARDVKEWHARYILTAVWHSFSPYRLTRLCTNLSSTPMGYVGLRKDNALSGKKCSSKLKNTHFIESVKSCIFAQVPRTRSPWWLNYEQWCLIFLLHVSLLAPYILRWLLRVWKIFKLLI
jgi:hypothetical protein